MVLDPGRSDCPSALSLMLSNTLACCTITKSLKSSTLRLLAVRAATAEALESGINPAVFSSAGKRKFRTSRSARSRATSDLLTRNNSEIAAQAVSGVDEAARLCSMRACGANARATAAAEPPPEPAPDFAIGLPRAGHIPRTFNAQAWHRERQVTEVLRLCGASIAGERKAFLAPHSDAAIHREHIGIAHFLEVIGG